MQLFLGGIDRAEAKEETAARQRLQAVARQRRDGQAGPCGQVGGAAISRTEAAYAEQRARLHTFRATLPAMRRTLAHVATYMICDDHDVTDDWFLDGAWCQQVLASPLGRRVVRNGLLAYALFQAWGNTPEQFAAPQGQALLTAVEAGDGAGTTAHDATISAALGLPDAFSGQGTLERGEQALHWHYTVAGPRYHVSVLDTRTERYYPSPRCIWQT